MTNITPHQSVHLRGTSRGGAGRVDYAIPFCCGNWQARGIARHGGHAGPPHGLCLPPRTPGPGYCVLRPPYVPSGHYLPLRYPWRYLHRTCRAHRVGGASLASLPCLLVVQTVHVAQPQTTLRDSAEVPHKRRAVFRTPTRHATGRRHGTGITPAAPPHGLHILDHAG